MGIVQRFSQTQQRQIKFTDLPEDIQMYIANYSDDPEHFVPEQKLLDATFVVQRLPVSSFPEFRITDSYRHGWDDVETYIQGMVDADYLPPVIIENGELIDGTHRIMAARQRGDEFIDAIDISYL